jgi:uncharacterized tellurite resistance protein B-like protein
MLVKANRQGAKAAKKETPSAPWRAWRFGGSLPPRRRKKLAAGSGGVPSGMRWAMVAAGGERMDENLKRQICQLVAGIVVADDDLDPTESAFIDRVLDRFGIPLEERDVIFPIVETSEAVARVSKLPADVQAETLDLLVEAAAADGKIVPEERDYLKAVAKALGRSEGDLAKLVAQHLKAPAG